MRQRRKNGKRTYFAVYTIVFAIIMAVGLAVFIANGKSLIWREDGFRQHYVALAYFGKWGRDIIRNVLVNHVFEIPLWDFHIGYGSDILTTLHYYVIGDPLNLLSVFVPSAYTEYLYGMLIVIRLYLAGVSFSLYCFEMKKSGEAALAGALTYVFCSYMLYGVYRHPFFINPMICLPLLLIGAERIFRKEKAALFTIMTFLSAVSNFYFFYMIVFAVCFYALVRFFTLEHENPGKELAATLLKFAGYASIGVCMAAVILLPVILQFLETSRMDVSQQNDFFYSADWYRRFFAYFIAPRKLGEWTNLGFTVPAALAVLVLFGKRKRHRALKLSFLILTGMLWLPFFGKALNGFSYVSNRWGWIYAGLVSYILVCMWEDLIRMKHVSGMFVFVGGVIYAVHFFRTGMKAAENIAGGLFLAGLILVCLLPRLNIKEKRAKLASGLLFCILFCHICLNWYMLFSGIGIHKASEAVDSGMALRKVMNSAPYAVEHYTEREDGFFRFEMDSFETANTAALAGVNGIQYFFSLENPNISEYLRGMELNRYRAFNYRDLDHRTFLDALAGVKYYAQKDADVFPFGYELKDTVILSENGYHIYENQYALPLGYTYDSRIDPEDYKNMESIQRQEALLQGVVLEDAEDDAAIRNISECRPAFTSETADYTLSCGEGVERQPDGSFAVNKKHGIVELAFSGMEKCETYLSLRGAQMDTGNPDDDEFILDILGDASRNTLRYNTLRHKYTDGQEDFLVNLGYRDEAGSVIRIRFPAKGVYRFDDIKIICQPMERYPEQIAALKRETLKQEEIGVNSVKGTISLKEDKILCLSIPYSKGFRAVVDGKKEPLLKANVMYMALPLSAGEHTVELHYRTPGLYPGIWISCMGFLLFAIIFRKKYGGGNGEE